MAQEIEPEVPTDSRFMGSGGTGGKNSTPLQRANCAGKGSDGTGGKNSTPLQGLIFSKSRVHGYGQILGKAD